MGTVAAGAFLADPMDGFPIGTPEGVPLAISWHGTLHTVSAAFFAGFAAVSSGSGGTAAVLAFYVAVAAAWAWVSAVSAHLYRQLHDRRSAAHREGAGGARGGGLPPAGGNVG